MRVLLTSEARFERTPDGAVWGPPAYGRGPVDAVSGGVCGRDDRGPREPMWLWHPAAVSRHRCRMCSSARLIAYSGLSGLLENLSGLSASVAAAVHGSSAIIVRAPSPIAYLTARAAARERRPFAVEVVGDADQVFSPGAFEHPLRMPIRWLAGSTQRRLSRDAIAVLYVTDAVLQRRYPTRGQMYAASDAALDDSAFASEDRREWSPATEFVLVTVGGLDQPVQGHRCSTRHPATASSARGTRHAPHRRGRPAPR